VGDLSSYPMSLEDTKLHMPNESLLKHWPEIAKFIVSGEPPFSAVTRPNGLFAAEQDRFYKFLGGLRIGFPLGSSFSASGLPQPRQRPNRQPALLKPSCSRYAATGAGHISHNIKVICQFGRLRIRNALPG
jgi:hypothetical protein